MKTFLIVIVMLIPGFISAQDNSIQTIFNNHGVHPRGGYASLSNKFSTIKGDYTNIVELYGGWYVNHAWFIGIEAAASTNDLPVAAEHSMNPGYKMSYEYVQTGLMTEYVIGSDKAIHVALQLFAGAGFTAQYHREEWQNGDDWNDFPDYDHDANWFYVAEPGVKVEVNVFRWMRFCPGISYRKAFNSKGRGLTDDDLSSPTLNLGLKFGKF
jgi:hypothetical protein